MCWQIQQGLLVYKKRAVINYSFYVLNTVYSLVVCFCSISRVITTCVRLIIRVLYRKMVCITWSVKFNTYIFTMKQLYNPQLQLEHRLLMKDYSDTNVNGQKVFQRKIWHTSTITVFYISFDRVYKLICECSNSLN